MTSESSWLRFRFGEQLDQWRWRHCFKLLFVRTVLEEEGERRGSRNAPTIGKMGGLKRGR
jgi:hypothetical protein